MAKAKFTIVIENEEYKPGFYKYISKLKGFIRDRDTLEEIVRDLGNRISIRAQSMIKNNKTFF